MTTLVNKDGYAYAYYPQRPTHLVATNKTWEQMVAESKQRNRTLVITEQQYNDLINRSFRTLLTEDQTASSIRDARNLLMKTYGWDKERADKFIRIDLRNDLPSLRSKQGRKIHSWCNENVY